MQSEDHAFKLGDAVQKDFQRRGFSTRHSRVREMMPMMICVQGTMCLDGNVWKRHSKSRN